MENATTPAVSGGTHHAIAVPSLFGKPPHRDEVHMRSAPGTRDRRRAGFLILALVLPQSPLISEPAVAARIVVTQDGSGDVETIGDGVALALATSEFDTIEVRAGFYDESVELGTASEPQPAPSHGMIVCPAGPKATRVRSITFSTGGSDWGVTGLAVDERVVERVEDLRATQWTRCVFGGGYFGIHPSWLGAAPNLVDCEFRGPTRLEGYGNVGEAFRGLRFVGAPLAVSNVFSLGFEDCVFEGPADTLVTAAWYGDYQTYFRRCNFSNADYAIAPVDRPVFDHVMGIASCTFENIRVAAIKYRHAYADLTYQPLRYLVAESRFVDCGRAIDWHGNGHGAHSIRNSVVIGCRDTAIVTGGSVIVRNLVLEDNGGPGLFVRAGFYYPTTPVLLPVRIDSLVVRRSAGPGLVCVEEPGAEGRVSSWIRSSEFVGNGGPGAVVTGQSFTIRDNLFAENADAGLVMEQAPGPLPNHLHQPDSLGGNTSALNRGPGILIRVPADLPRKTRWTAHHNLAVGNDGGGLVVAGDGTLGTVHANLAWLNVPGNFAGLESGSANLEADPRLCNVYAADFALQGSSPCAPSGPLGRIGAFGVGCAASHVELQTVGQAPPPHARGRVHVALLGHRLLDPRSVDPATVRLGGASQAPGPAGTRYRDANHDGIMDAIYAFPADEIATTPAGAVHLTAATFGGSELSGSVVIRERPAALPPGPVPFRPATALEILTVTPGPTAGRVEVELSSPGESPIQVSVFDVTGRRVQGSTLEARPGTRRIEVGGLRPGVYFGLFRSGGERVMRRMVVR